ncbi:MAG: tRNA (adenosine(37)-N6)-threonylcarbamoyltransferase complex ATPase subunit type 1 TsaE [Bdellovibrionota bacterium]
MNSLNRPIVSQEKLMIKNKSEAREFIVNLAKTFHKRQILLLQGEMGAGKTQLVTWLAQQYALAAANTNTEAQSPTYAFHNRYAGAHGNIEHFDLDRIQSDADLESIGFWDIFASATGWVIIEWPERINWRHLPKSWALTHVKVERVQKGSENEERSFEVVTY